jgi:hypothetical protein
MPILNIVGGVPLPVTVMLWSTVSPAEAENVSALSCAPPNNTVPTPGLQIVSDSNSDSLRVSRARVQVAKDSCDWNRDAAGRRDRAERIGLLAALDAAIFDSGPRTKHPPERENRCRHRSGRGSGGPRRRSAEVGRGRQGWGKQKRERDEIFHGRPPRAFRAAAKISSALIRTKFLGPAVTGAGISPRAIRPASTISVAIAFGSIAGGGLGGAARCGPGGAPVNPVSSNSVRGANQFVLVVIMAFNRCLYCGVWLHSQV